jgi:hypothetical protein
MVLFAVASAIEGARFSQRLRLARYWFKKLEKVSSLTPGLPPASFK